MWHTVEGDRGALFAGAGDVDLAGVLTWAMCTVSPGKTRLAAAWMVQNG
ncbi:MAG TPA: hypothetical protein VFX16_10630 [Pseudonocardiaceae bacterium]|nr:hypothetical protein [Pseudonocardiaceae bacterium]